MFRKFKVKSMHGGWVIRYRTWIFFRRTMTHLKVIKKDDHFQPSKEILLFNTKHEADCESVRLSSGYDPIVCRIYENGILRRTSRTSKWNDKWSAVK